MDDITEESSDDEVTLSELVTKARSGKVKQAGNLSAEDRNVTRSAKLRHSVKEDDLSSSPRTEKANSRVSNRREDGKSGRVVGIQRESRKEERTSSRLSGRLSERGRPLARGQ